MANYKPQKGDRVRVVLEGEVTATGVSTSDFWLEGKRLYLSGHAVKSVEVLAPPVEVFGSGTVRSRIGQLYSLGPEGYFSHQSNCFHRWGSSVTRTYFTSKNYERVDLP